MADGDIGRQLSFVDSFGCFHAACLGFAADALRRVGVIAKVCR